MVRFLQQGSTSSPPPASHPSLPAISPRSPPTHQPLNFPALLCIRRPSRKPPLSGRRVWAKRSISLEVRQQFRLVCGCTSTCRSFADRVAPCLSGTPRTQPAAYYSGIYLGLAHTVCKRCLRHPMLSPSASFISHTDWLCVDVCRGKTRPPPGLGCCDETSVMRYRQFECGLDAPLCQHSRSTCRIACFAVNNNRRRTL